MHLVAAFLITAAATAFAQRQTPFIFQQHSAADPGGQRLVRTDSETGLVRWMAPDEVDALHRLRVRFMDVTDTVRMRMVDGMLAQILLNGDLAAAVALKDLSLPVILANGGFPDAPAHGAILHPFLDTNKHMASVKFMRRFLTRYTAFRTRYYRSKTGVLAQQYLFSVIQRLAADASSLKGLDITVREVTHAGWPQKSIVARFPGTSPDSATRAQVVIVGAHLDSVNMWMPAYGRAPGADDDGSGTSTTLHAFQNLIRARFRPLRTVEFHWYAAEEAGLLGSQAVAEEYRRAGISVVAMLQNDMTGYAAPGRETVVGVVTDRTHAPLTAFLVKLIREYTPLVPHEMQCGYGCSDHASWSQAGYASAFHFETDDLHANPNVHTSGDVVETVSFEHMRDMAKTALAFAVELGGVNGKFGAAEQSDVDEEDLAWLDL